MTNCPHCAGELGVGAAFCRHCTRRAVKYMICPACKEPMAQEATHCSSCGQRPPNDQELAVRQLQIEVRATNLGAFFTSGITGLFFPPVISVNDGRIKITKWSFLGLRIDHQEIQVSRVASVRYTKGIIWGGLLVETFGGSVEDLAQRGLRQEDARAMAEQLKAVITDRD